MERWSGILGLIVLLGIAWLLSTNRKKISLRPVLWGIALQIIFALLVLRTAPGHWLFNSANKFFNVLIGFTQQGAAFVFNELAIPPGAGGKLGFFFAFQVLTTIIFFASLMGVLYHIGIMQWVVRGMARIMVKTMGTSGAETLSCAGNIFVGQTEAPLLVRPYIRDMTLSEIMAVMTCGFATIAGGVMAAYVSFGVDAGHLLAASVMSAPAALMMAKIMIPETERPKTLGTVKLQVEKTTVNVIDAAASGAGDGMRLALNVAAMLLAFLALIAMLNYLLGLVDQGLQTVFRMEPVGLSLESIFGFLFRPVAFLMGVTWDQARHLGSLLGTHIFGNEFLAYQRLTSTEVEFAGGIREAITGRTFTVATYAFCGFCNLGSIAIQIGGIGAIAPERRHDLARVGLRAMIAGALACYATACVAGLIVGDDEAEYKYRRMLARKAIAADHLALAAQELSKVAEEHHGSQWAASAQALLEQVRLVEEALRQREAGDIASARASLVRVTGNVDLPELGSKASRVLKALPQEP